MLPLTAPGNFELPAATVTIESVSDDGTIVIKATSTAVFVWLSTLAQGRFSENGFMLLPGTKEIKFIAPAGMARP